jgi:hypothetical protein
VASAGSQKLAYTFPNTSTTITEIPTVNVDQLNLCPGCSAFYLVRNDFHKNGFFTLNYNMAPFKNLTTNPVAFVVYSKLPRIYDMTFLNNVLLPPFNDDHYTVWIQNGYYKNITVTL